MVIGVVAASVSAPVALSDSGRQWSIAQVATTSLVADSSVVVGVLDTGIAAHPDLGWRVTKSGVGRPSGATLPGYDFVSDPWSAADGDGWDSDPTDMGDGVRISESESRPDCKARISSWHGTNVAGIIASRRTSATSIVGIATGARILPVRILGRCGGNTADVAAAVLWAAGHRVASTPMNPNPARIINLSLSGKSATCPRSLQTAFDIAESLGSVIVVASGSGDVNTKDQTPANCANVITVGAVDRIGKRAPTSNYGAEVTISAPGGNMAVRETDGIYTTTNSGKYRPRKATYGYFQGSSAAAAHVSGVLALLVSRKPDLTPAQIRTIVTSPDVLQPFGPGQCDAGEGLCGAGILRVDKVLSAYS